MIEIGHRATGTEEVAVGVVVVRGTELVVDVGQGGDVAEAIRMVVLADTTAGVGEETTNTPCSPAGTAEVLPTSIADLRVVRSIAFLDDEHPVVEIVRLLGVGPRGGSGLEADRAAGG